jgi:hypothetical protein
MKETLLILLGVVLTSLFQFLTAFITKRSDKRLNHSDQLKLLASEIEDLTRHCAANLHVLKAIDLGKGIPSGIHFEKMKILESSILFAPDTYSIINSKYTRHINRLKLEIRNINAEVQYVINYRKQQHIDTKVFAVYLDYLISKMEFTIDNLPARLADLIKLDHDTLARIKQYKKDDEKIVRKIIYE